MPNQKIALSLFLSLSSIYLQAAEPAVAAPQQKETGQKATKPKASHASTEQAKLTFIAEFDQDADNKVSLDEFERSRAARFATMQQFGNGKVDQAAYQAEYAERLDRALANDRTGQIKQTEVRFAALDKNKDQLISRAEYDATGERGFAFLDTNQDGIINQADPAPKPREQAKPTAAQKAGQQPKPIRPAVNQTLKMPTSHDLAGMLAMYDQNHDQAVTKAEYLALRDASFANTDVDHNGSLSSAEYLDEFVDRLDQQVARVRTAQLQQTTVRFATLDSNQDQWLSEAEYQQAGLRTFARWDSDQNSEVTLQEALPTAQQSMQLKAAVQPAQGHAEHNSAPKDGIAK